MRGLNIFAAFALALGATGPARGAEAPVRPEERLLARYRERLPKEAKVVFCEEGVGGLPEAFAISEQKGTLRIAGATRRARLYGLGRLLREPAFRGESAPQMSVRGIGFSPHGGNDYERAEGRTVCEGIEELALWGCNTLVLWLDMSELTGTDDPRFAARVALERMAAKAALECGMRVSLLGIVNETFAGVPVRLRCPSDPGNLAHILADRAKVLAPFADLRISQFCAVAYGLGGCACANCAPWGTRGLWTLLPGLAKTVASVLPGCRLELDASGFDLPVDRGEWRGTFQRGEDLRAYVDCLSVDRLAPVATILPGELPCSVLLRLEGQPDPRRCVADWVGIPPSAVGFRAWSEGFGDNFNKVLFLQFGWDKKRTWQEVEREYALFHPGFKIEGEEPATLPRSGLVADTGRW